MPKVKAERTCINCRKKAQKSAFFRIVRTPEGNVAFDATGNMAGRGAYVCSKGCLSQAIGSGKLSRALRVKLTGELSRIEHEMACADAVEVH